jgi:hypothetical protein
MASTRVHSLGYGVGMAHSTAWARYRYGMGVLGHGMGSIRGALRGLWAL